MKRLLLVPVLLLAALAVPVSVAAPAHAKGPDRVQISGPGLEDVWLMSTRRDDIDAWTLMEASNLFQIWGSARGGERPALTDEQLGAAYVLTWYVQDYRVTETVAYPFAEGGAWVTTTDGMEDWMRSGGRLRRVMTRLGAIRPGAAVTPAAVTGRSTTTDPQAAVAAAASLADLVAWWSRP